MSILDRRTKNCLPSASQSPILSNDLREDHFFRSGGKTDLPARKTARTCSARPPPFFIASPPLFITSLRASFARRKDVVNNAAHAGQKIWRCRVFSDSSTEVFAHRPATNICSRRWTSLSKLSGRAARFVLDEYSRNNRSRRFTIKISRGQSQRGGKPNTL